MTDDEALTRSFDTMLRVIDERTASIHPLIVLRIVKEYADAIRIAYSLGELSTRGEFAMNTRDVHPLVTSDDGTLKLDRVT